MQEAGIPGFAVTSWISIYGPPRMPSSLRARIEETVRSVMAAPEARKRLTSAGFEPAWKDGAALSAFQEAEIERWRGVVRTAGLRLDG